MSKKKRTLDDLLGEALVQEEEQPYKIPNNWLWVKLEAVTNFINGDRGKNYPSQKDFLENGIPFINAGNIQNGNIDISKMNYISDEKYDLLSSGKIVKNDVLYCLRGTLGKTAIVREIEKGAIASSLVILRPHINNNYLFWYLISPLGTSMINVHNNGSAQPNLSANNVKKYTFPLPPINEQQRIANKIQILFDKIDEANQLIDEAKETFGLRRAGVLEAALKGELTTSFRKNEVVEDAHILYKKLKSEATFKAKINPDILESDIRHSIPSTWKWVKLGDVLKITSGGTPKKAFKEYYVDGKVPWIKTGEIKWNRIPEAEEHITQLGVEKSSAKWLPKKSVLVAMYGQGLTRGRAAILDIEATCNQAVCALLPSPYITPEYLYYYFMEGYNRFRSIAKGGNQENLSATMISEFLLPLPPLKEQLKIVELLDEFFNKELQVKELLNINVDEIKSAVLSKAFKGELGTNDAADEPAIELLKSILQEKL
ncbi:restriction endonuclease subunit S [Paenibacillus sp. JJ1683]